MTISTLFMKFNLYGLVITWIQEAPAINAPCISDVCDGRRWWYRNRNSISILRMQKPSWNHEYHRFHPCTVPKMIPQTCAQHATCEIHNMKSTFWTVLWGPIVGQLYLCKYGMLLWMAFHSWIIIQEPLYQVQQLKTWSHTFFLKTQGKMYSILFYRHLACCKFDAVLTYSLHIVSPSGTPPACLPL